MLIRLPVCLVKEINVSEDGEGPQYLTILEPGGGEYNFTARPNDPEHPCDAASRLQFYADSFVPCDIEAEISGFMLHKDGVRKQLLSIHKLGVKPVKLEPPAAKNA
jgi:hypothetical protein